MISQSLIALIAFSALLVGAMGTTDKNYNLETDNKNNFAPRQLFLGKGKETSTPEFVRLVVMRLIYGIASSMGVEERLEDAFNGAFVPPNANDGVGIGDLGGDEGDGGLLGGIFDDDVL